jgi:hypothetical protein
VIRNSRRECPAQVDNGRTVAGSLIERLICKRNQPALTTAEPFYQYVKRMWNAIPEHDRELLFPGIVTGNRASADRTGITAVKYYPLACENATLDDVNKERGNA